MSAIAERSASSPRLWFVCPRLGADSQTWLWRQLCGLRRLERTVVTGERTNARVYPVEDATILEDASLRSEERNGSRFLHRLRRLPQRNFFALGRDSLRRWMKWAEREPPDILLCHFGQSALGVLPFARAHGIPVVAHFHGLDLSSSLRNRWYRWSLEANLRHFSDAIVVGSHQRKRLLQMGMPAERVHLIPCGVPVDRFEGALGDLAFERRPLRFLTVSRLVHQKGVHVALEAFAWVIASGVSAELHIVGEGPERRRLEREACAYGIASSVFFHGSLPESAVSRWMADSDVFLQHSLHHRGWVEGFGVSITEASASGLPVVVTRSGGIQDQVIEGTTGFMVEEGDAYTMADRMLQLAHDPMLRRKMGREGRERARLLYDTPRQIARLEDVLLRAVARARA